MPERLETAGQTARDQVQVDLALQDLDMGPSRWEVSGPIAGRSTMASPGKGRHTCRGLIRVFWVDRPWRPDDERTTQAGPLP